MVQNAFKIAPITRFRALSSPTISFRHLSHYFDPFSSYKHLISKKLSQCSSIPRKFFALPSFSSIMPLQRCLPKRLKPSADLSAS